MRLIYLLLLICCFYSAQAISIQKDSLSKDSVGNFKTNNFAIRDSATIAKKALMRDSLIKIYLKPNPNRANQFTDSLLKTVLIEDKYLLTPSKSVKIKKNNYGFGETIAKDPIWFLVSSISLLILFGIIKILFKN